MKTMPDKVQKHRRQRPKTELLPKAIRHLVFSLAIPSIMSGCAHHPRTAPAAEQAAASPGKRVFRVGPSRDAQRHMDTYAETLPELSESFSSAAIIENILSRHKKLTAETLHLKPGLRGAKDQARQLAPQAIGNPLQAKSRQTLAASGIKAVSRSAARKSHGHRDHWETVRSRLVLASVEHEMVDAQLDRLRSHPGAVNFLMKRAEPYLQYLLEEIDRQGLPTDLVLVPMVESAFETNALSPKQAAGIWQFIPSTGQSYGLEVSDTYDGRYDVHASTQAALKYLKHLNKLFNGDWMLAFAAYNAGEGAVQRAIDASRKAGESGTFWDLRLPAETQAYVLKILSLARMIADPEGYGLKPYRAPTQAYLTRVEVGPEVSISDLIASAGMAPDEFYRLNPAFKPDVEPPAKPRNLLMPADKAQALAANVAGAKLPGMLKVVVKKGETLSILAKRHGVPELKLAEWNNLRPRAPLKPGQELVVYPV
jgi:membrane-bound lytic murein transglycosylase D